MTQCEHIHGNGTRCLSPVLHRRSFCYMHWRLREHKLAVPPEPEFQLPTIDSEASVVLASNQIAAAVLAGKLDTRKARVVLACLKMAVDSLRRMEDVSDVAELVLTPAMEQELVGKEGTDNVGKDVSQVRTNDVGTEGNDVGTENNVGTEGNDVGTENNVGTEENNVGTGALARAGGAPAPRSTAPNHNNSLTPFQQSAQAFLADLTTSVPTTIEDLEQVFDRHPLMTQSSV